MQLSNVLVCFPFQYFGKTVISFVHVHICDFIFIRSIIEPVRNTGFRDSAHFHLSYVTDVDTSRQQLSCTSVIRPDLQYVLSYDKLVIGVGALTNTFGVPGVEEHAFFLKVTTVLNLIYLYLFLTKTSIRPSCSG